MDKTIIYFDEKKHEYTDNFGNTYTSVTTKLAEFYNKFQASKIARACERIGRNPYHKDYMKYKGKDAKQLQAEWKKTSQEACDKGNERHDYLETSVKVASGYNLVEGKYIHGQIHTVADILDDEEYGVIDLELFAKHGVKDNYPKIYNLIEKLSNDGFRFYAEIGVFSLKYLISGLIDLLAVKGKQFIIVDWKTNRADIRFDPGYFKKDMFGNLTDEYINNNDYFLPPISDLAASTGNKYAMQLSSYTFLCEQFGLSSIGNVLCHIKHDVYTNDDIETKDNSLLIGKSKVRLLSMPNLSKEVKLILEHNRVDNLFN